jgi:hypothetical protein
MRLPFVVCSCAIAIGCSLDAAGTAGDLTDASAGDVAIGSDGAQLDSIFVLDDTAPEDTTPLDTAPPCDESTCGMPPTSAKRVALVDRSVACPAGFDSTDVVEETSGDGCGCSCSIAAAPSCPAAGGIATSYGDSPACATAGPTLIAVDSSTCSSFGSGSTLPGYVRATPPGPVGGACGPSPSTKDVSRPRRICEPRAGTCAEPICRSPFVECIEIAGSCPSSFPTARRIGTSASVSCPACTCALSATCTGTFTLYDKGCTGSISASIRADGTCIAMPGAGTSGYSDFKYVPNTPTASCAASYASSPGTRTFVGERNLCCK